MRRSDKPVNLARMHATPFSERLVKKFELPTAGWRGPLPSHQQEAKTSALPMVQPKHNVISEANGFPKLSVGREIPYDPRSPQDGNMADQVLDPSPEQSSSGETPSR